MQRVGVVVSRKTDMDAVTDRPSATEGKRRMVVVGLLGFIVPEDEVLSDDCD